MDNKKLNTTTDFEFYDGTTVKLTLTFYAIYQLKNKNKSLYDRYSRIMTKGPADELEMITVLYAAYVCANSDDENILTEEEFLMQCGSDRMAVKKAIEELVQPKKQKGFDNHSNKEHIQDNQK